MLKIKLSNRARQTPPSPIRKLAHLAKKAKAAGNHVYHLNIGQPDIASPKEFFDGIRLFDQEVLAYDQSQGNDALCSAWTSYMNKTMKLNIAPEQLMITTGASEALVFMFMTCCDPGDEVIIFDPTYANYMGFAALAGVNLVPILSDFRHGFALPERKVIEERITNRTRAVLLCNPNNPTGTVYSKEELQSMLDLCDEYNIFLIVDETYREFVYDGVEPISIFQIAPKNKRVIVIDSLSKRFSLCGARIGCLITCNEEVLATTLNIAQARLCAPTLEQIASAYMLNIIGDDYLEQVRTEYQDRRDVLVEAISQYPSMEIQRPKGAFYAIVKLPVDNSEEFASFMLSEFALNNRTTFVAPASGFYMQNSKGANKIRIAFVLAKPDIEEAVHVLGAGLEAYLKRK